MKFVPNPRKNRRKAPALRHKSGLKLNLKELFITRGIRHPYSEMSKLGISHAVIHSLISGTQVLLKIVHVEKICLALRCTPNDLFRWAPLQGANVPQSHPLHSLNRTLTEASLSTELAEMSLDHLRVLKKVAAELKNGKLPMEEK